MYAGLPSNSPVNMVFPIQTLEGPITKNAQTCPKCECFLWSSRNQLLKHQPFRFLDLGNQSLSCCGAAIKFDHWVHFTLLHSWHLVTQDEGFASGKKPIELAKMPSLRQGSIRAYLGKAEVWLQNNTHGFKFFFEIWEGSVWTRRESQTSWKMRSIETWNYQTLLLQLQASHTNFTRGT